MSENENLKKEIDWKITILPLIGILVLFFLFVLCPEKSKEVLEYIRDLLGNEFGSYYLVVGLGVFIISLYIAFSRYGNIRLGTEKKPEYGSFRWGTMIFTSTMAADIVFYSLCEWSLYAQEKYITELGGIQRWAATYPLFHWGPIPWSFYVVLAAAFGFMLHVKKEGRQKFSEACRPLLGKYTDGIIGKLIDLIAVFALLAGTATTFSLATPLMAAAMSELLGISDRTVIFSIFFLVLIAFVYTLTVWFGMKAIAKLASGCVLLFMAFLIYVLWGGGEARYIIETGISSIGNLVQNFIVMSTWTDPLRETSFPQNWTVFYWSYWMVWCVATPFFIGSISKGRTIRNTILGGYGWGLAGTFTSFIILGNYGLAKQMDGTVDVLGLLDDGGSLNQVILEILRTLPLHQLAFLLLIITMIAFYATTFDALTMVISFYSYKELVGNRLPDKRVRVFWSVLFILLPCALIFSENSMSNLQTISIIAAFPVSVVIILIIGSFLKESKRL